MIELLKKLVSIHGVTGFESSVRDCIFDLIPKSSQTHVDNLGNLVVTLGSGSEGIIFAAHMDELGLIVSDIREDGYVLLRSLGSIDPRVMPGRVLRIKTEKGEIRGVVGLKPPHLMKNVALEMEQVIPFEELYLDIGADSKQEAESMGVEILCPVTFDKTFEILNNKYISARALDDRAGCAILIKVIQDLANQTLTKKIHFAFTVQEERGLRGAQLVAKNYSAPYAFAIDTSSSGIIPFSDKSSGPAVLGKGPALRAIDNKHISDPQFVKKIKTLAEKNSIPIQVIFTGGSTDVAELELQGPKSLPISFPIRYTHSTVEMVNIHDLEQTTVLIKTLIKQLD